MDEGRCPGDCGGHRRERKPSGGVPALNIGTLLEGRAIWYHEFEDTNQQVTAAFGGGSDFNAAGPGVGRDTAAIGAGLFAYAQTGVSFQLNYDALLRQDFVGHTGSGRLKVEF